MAPHKLSKQKLEVKSEMEKTLDINRHFFQLLSPALASQADGLGANTEASAAGPRKSVGLKKSKCLGGPVSPLPSLSLPSLTCSLLLAEEKYRDIAKCDPPGGDGPHPVLERAGSILVDHRSPPGGKQGQTLNLLILAKQAELGLGPVGLDLVLLVAPTTPLERMGRIAQSSRGFTYLVSVTGVTGERSTMENRVEGLVQALKQTSTVPVAVGFGISGVEQVRQVRSWGADGAIVGSALVKRMASAGPGSAAAEAGLFCSELRKAAD